MIAIEMPLLEVGAVQFILFVAMVVSIVVAMNVIGHYRKRQ